MALAICVFCGGPVIAYAAMCPHCGQRGRSHATRGGLLMFGGRKRLPKAVRRLIVVGIVGTGAIVSLALAHLARPARLELAADDIARECAIIQEGGEEAQGELNACMNKFAKRRFEELRRANATR